MAAVSMENNSGLSIITLTDITRGNLLNPESLSALTAFFREIPDTTRIVLLKAAGPSFCSGMDLDALIASGGNPEQAAEYVRLYHDLLAAIFTHKVPVIALVRGMVKAGGVGLACACDIVLAADTATFELSEVLFGLVPANVFPYLFGYRLSPQRLKYLTMTARRLSAREAHEAGLVDDYFPAEFFEREVRKVLKGLFRASPDALARVKRTIDASMRSGFDERLALGVRTLLDIIGNEKVLAEIRKFREGDLPVWFERFGYDGSLTTEGGEDVEDRN